MKKSIGIIIVILILIFIILFTIMLTKNKQQDENKQAISKKEEGKSDEIVIKDKYNVKYVDNRTNYYVVEKIIEQYYTTIMQNDSNKLINMLYDEYIAQNSITTKNIMETIKDENVKYSRNYKIIINKVLFAEENDRINTYFIDLYYCNLDYNDIYDTKLMIQLDMINSTFQITPYEYMKKINCDDLDIDDSCNTGVKEISKNDNNIFTMTPISKNSMPERLFNLYIDYIQYNKEAAYYLLNQEYRENKFGNIDTYLEYLNKKDLEIYIEKYQINEYDDYTQYICIDNTGDSYIFNEFYIMNFDIMLDNYTIDNKEYIEMYNECTEQQKVALNINKFFEAINSKDYRYAYNCLEESFKLNYFISREQFEEFVEKNFYEKNKIGYTDFIPQNQVYTYSIVITDEKSNSNINKKFIVKLKEGTDFEISFNIE